MQTIEKHCHRHGPERHPYCVDCLKDDYAENAGKHPDEDGWGEILIKPLAKIMIEKGIRHLAISIENGNATYVLEPKDDPFNA